MEVRNGVVVSLRLREGDSQIVVGHCHIWIELQDDLVVLYGFVDFPLAGQGIGQVVLGLA